MVIDYSKWNKIEVSDDEDDTHPNIDTGSLFRWRHQARVQRMEEMETEKEALKSSKNVIQHNLEEVRSKYENALQEGKSEEIISSYKHELDAALKEKDNIIIKEAEFLKKEKSQALNVDTLSKPGFDSSHINSYDKPKKNDEEEYADMSSFVKKYKTEIEYYGMLRNLADSREYLIKNLYLVSDHTCGYLCIWTIDLAVEEKWALFDLVSHQAICLQFMLELLKTMNIPKNRLVQDFFNKINQPNQEYKQGFEDELNAFKQRAKERAQIRIKEAVEKEKLDLQDRIGPGGLDPVEVFQSLPESMKKAFESQDKNELIEALSKLSPDEVKYHMKRCEDSGLWVPGPKDDENDENVEDEEYQIVE